MNRSKALVVGLLSVLGLFVALQLVPYGRDHANPPAGTPVAWDTPRTEALARRACFDCHSNETRWPWYSNVAPISWRVQKHVDEGRAKLNFSDFRPGNEEVGEAAGEAAETVQKGEMPLQDYLLAHADARLTEAEKKELMRGLEATFAAFAEAPEGGAAEREGGPGEAKEGAEHERAEHERAAASRKR